jgi:hypothetical protein
MLVIKNRGVGHAVTGVLLGGGRGVPRGIR